MMTSFHKTITSCVRLPLEVQFFNQAQGEGHEYVQADPVLEIPLVGQDQKQQGPEPKHPKTLSEITSL